MTAQIFRCLFHHFDAFRFRRHGFKNFRMICLGNPQIKIPVKLLNSTVIMGMDYAGSCHIGNTVSCLNHACCVDHVFIENRVTDESSLTLINILAVHGTHIGTHVSLDAQLRNIFFSFHAILGRIIKAAGKHFNG